MAALSLGKVTWREGGKTQCKIIKTIREGLDKSVLNERH